MAAVADRLSATERTRLKFCGLTRAADVDAAVRIGADAIGFNCYEKSPRFVAPDQLALLAAILPAYVTPVLLFVNATDEEVRRALERIPHALLQFHGNESPQQCRALNRPYVRGLPVDRECDWSAAEAEFGDAAALLADAPAPGFGGSGQRFDWRRLPAAAARRLPLVLAGGLTAANVREAIATVRPYAVDVSSGIEDAPGVKSERKMREFASAVFAANATLART